MDTGKSLQELVQELPPDMHDEVRDFIEFLLARKVSQATGTRRARRIVGQSWAGALSEYRRRYTSVELQHQATSWRGD